MAFCSIPVLVFALPHLISKTPINLYESWPSNLQQRAQLTSDYGFDRPLFTQGVRWFHRLVTGQWGQSRYYNRSVFDEAVKASKLTVVLLLWIVLAWGVWAGVLRMARWFCLALELPWRSATLTPWFKALPAFLLAIVLRNFFLRQFGWIGPSQGLLLDPYYLLNPLYMFPPAAVLALPHILLWNAREPQDSYAIPLRRGHHVYRSMAHCVRDLHPRLGMFLMEVCLAEYIFSFPGLGSLGIEALKRRDIPMLQGFILCTAGLYFALRLLCQMPMHPSYPTAALLPGPLPYPAAGVCKHSTLYRALWYCLILCALATWGPQLAPHDPMEIHGRDQFLLPGYRYILGTDFLGRDVLSRTIKGFRSSIPRVILLTVLVGGASWCLVSLASLLPKPLKSFWQQSHHCLLTPLPPFLLAFMAFLIAEQSHWALEIALFVAGLSAATQLLGSKVAFPFRLIQWGQIGGWLLLLEVMFYFLNLSSESFIPTWGSDIRHSMQYGHMNIWMLLAPSCAIVWSCALFHHISERSPVADNSFVYRVTMPSQLSETEVR